MSAAGTAAMPRRTEREAKGRCNGRRGREEQREERELCVKVFEIQLMRDHIFHLSLSLCPSQASIQHPLDHPSLAQSVHNEYG